MSKCNVDRLPEFGSTNDRNRPDSDRFQALVPAYTFQCSGKVTEWRACVEPGGKSDEQYYIQFQVWRPTGVGDGCYSLVDFNIPLDSAMEEEREISESSIIIEAEGFLSPPGDDKNPLHRCVVLPVRESQQIEVQAGDIVGYYVDRFKRGTEDKNDGGIQWIENDSDVVVYYKDDLSRQALKPHYALGGCNSTECGFQASTNLAQYSLHLLRAARPIISVSVTGMSNILHMFYHLLNSIIIATAKSIQKYTASDNTLTLSPSMLQEPVSIVTFTNVVFTPTSSLIISFPSTITASPSPPTETDSRSAGNSILVGLVVAAIIAVLGKLKRYNIPLLIIVYSMLFSQPLLPLLY